MLEVSSGDGSGAVERLEMTDVHGSEKLGDYLDRTRQFSLSSGTAKEARTKVGGSISSETTP